MPAPMKAPPAETVSGTPVVGEGPVTSAVEEGGGVVPGADAAEEGTPLEGTTGLPDDGTPTVGTSDGGPLRGAVAVDSAEVTGAGGGTLYEEAGGTGTDRPDVAHTVEVTVTVTAGAQAARQKFSTGYMSETLLHTYSPCRGRQRHQ